MGIRRRGFEGVLPIVLLPPGGVIPGVEAFVFVKKRRIVGREETQTAGWWGKC